MNLKIVGVIVAVIVGIIGIGVLSDNNDTASTDSVNMGRNTYGTSDTKVVVKEIGDFECPACASFYPIVKEVKEKYKDQIEFEYIHMPLTAIHPNAFAAHRAAQAAALQGKFWEMHDLLYENHDAWVSTATNDPVSFFDSYAEQIGLDLAQFRLDYSSAAVNDFIQSNIREARAMGAEATPSFYINDEQVDNSELTSVDAFSAVIDAKLAETAEPTDSADTSN